VLSAMSKKMSRVTLLMDKSSKEKSKPCNHHALEGKNEVNPKFNLIVNKLFQKEVFGKGFVMTQNHHVHSKFRATCTKSSNFLTFDKKGLIKIHNRIYKKQMSQDINFMKECDHFQSVRRRILCELWVHITTKEFKRN
jgi:hypothetical protein